MLKQYSTLTKCLAELKNSDLPVIEKLKLEVQLIQTKRILLDYGVELRVTGVASSEKDFSELLEQVQAVCRNGKLEGGLDLVKTHMEEIKKRLTPLTYQQAQAAGGMKALALDAVRKPLPCVKDIFSRQERSFKPLQEPALRPKI
jgi:hypothetical protein